MATRELPAGYQVCSQCGGDGSIDAATFGDYGRHSCYRCGETGYEKVPTGKALRQELKAEARNAGYAAADDRYRVSCHDAEGSGRSFECGSARTLAYAWAIAKRNDDEYSYCTVYDRVERREVFLPYNYVPVEPTVYTDEDIPF